MTINYIPIHSVVFSLKNPALVATTQCIACAVSVGLESNPDPQPANGAWKEKWLIGFPEKIGIKYYIKFKILVTMTIKYN